MKNLIHFYFFFLLLSLQYQLSLTNFISTEEITSILPLQQIILENQTSFDIIYEPYQNNKDKEEIIKYGEISQLNVTLTKNYQKLYKDADAKSICQIVTHSMKLKKRESIIDHVNLLENEMVIDTYFTKNNEIFLLTNFFNIIRFPNLFTIENTTPEIVFTMNRSQPLTNIKDTKLTDLGIISCFSIKNNIFFIVFSHEFLVIFIFHNNENRIYTAVDNYSLMDQTHDTFKKREHFYDILFYEKYLYLAVGKDGVDIYEFYGGHMTFLHNYLPHMNKTDIRSVSCFTYGYQHFLVTLDYASGIQINNFVFDYENYMYELTEKSQLHIPMTRGIKIRFQNGNGVVAELLSDGINFKLSEIFIDLSLWKSELHILESHHNNLQNFQNLHLVGKYCLIITDYSFLIFKHSFIKNDYKDKLSLPMNKIISVKTRINQMNQKTEFFAITKDNNNITRLEKFTVEEQPLKLQCQTSYLKSFQTLNISIEFYSQMCPENQIADFKFYCKMKENIQVGFENTQQNSHMFEENRKKLKIFLVILMTTLIIFTFLYWFYVRIQRSKENFSKSKYQYLSQHGD